MIASVFIGTSVDGFIARLNGSFDFLPEGGGEPHGYNEFFASVKSFRNLKAGAFATFMSMVESRFSGFCARG